MAKKKSKTASSESPLGVTLALIASATVMVGVMSLPFLLATPNGK